ncbi:MAG: cupin domain-containing protein [Polaromonas sp.]
MTPFATMPLPANRTVVAPDGSDVRVLLRLHGGSMAHFSLQAGQTSAAVAHRTVEEVWYVVEGRGQMWRKQGEVEETVTLLPGICLTIPLGTHFQFRAAPDQPLGAVCVTMPPWPTEPDADEAVPVAGPWSSA